MPGADTLFAASPKLLTPSPLREPGGVAQFAAPPAPPPTYCPAPTGALPLPSLLRLTRDDAAALPDCCEWLPDAEGCAETIVVGTAHVSDASVAEVAAAIAALRPDAVLLEICSGRTQMLEKIDLSAPPNLEQMLKQIQDGADLFSVVYPWFLATVAESLEVVPGAEFRAGFLAAAALSEGQVLYGQDPETQERKLLGYMNEADAIERTRETLLGADTAQPHEQLVLPRPRDGEEQELSQEQQLWVALYNARAACACPVVLADRHINATVSRVWGSLTPWDRVRLLGSFAWQGLVLPDADELKDQTEGFKGKQGKDLLTEAVAELAEDFPAFTAVLIDERDEWLAQQLYSCARNDVIERIDENGEMAPRWPKRVLAVVGAGHVPGMQRYWQEVAVDKGPRADLAAAYAPFPPRPHDRRNSWLLGIGLTALGVGMIWGAWKGMRKR